MEQDGRQDRPERVSVRRITVAPGAGERMQRTQYDPWTRDVELSQLAAIMSERPAPGKGGA